jgi:hypothetical protein
MKPEIIKELYPRAWEISEHHRKNGQTLEMTSREFCVTRARVSECVKRVTKLSKQPQAWHDGLSVRNIKVCKRFGINSKNDLKILVHMGVFRKLPNVGISAYCKVVDFVKL